MQKLNEITGIHVKIKKSDFPTPFGLDYYAKGFYIQGKYAIVVGNLGFEKHTESTIRLKYPIDNVSIELI